MAEVRLKFSADSTGFEIAAARVQKRAAQLANEVAGSGGSISRALGGVAGSVISVSAARDVIRFASEINDLSAATDESTDRIQELSYAATQNGSDVQSMVRAMRNLAEARKAALENPSGDEAKSFKGLGITQDELQRIRSSGDLLYRVGDAVKAVNIDANSLPMILQLIGSRNQSVLPAMKAGLSEAAEEARRLNLILGNDTVQSLDKVGDAIDRSLLGIKGPLAGVVLFITRSLDTIITSILSIPSLISLNFNYMRVKALESLNAIDKAIRESPLGKIGDKIDAVTGNKPEQSAPGHFFDEPLRNAKFELKVAEQEFGKLFNGILDRYDDTKAAKTKPHGMLADMPTPTADAKQVKLKVDDSEAEKIVRLQERIRDAQIEILQPEERKYALQKKLADLEQRVFVERTAILNKSPLPDGTMPKESVVLEKELEIYQTRRELNQLDQRDRPRPEFQTDERAKIGALIGGAVGGPLDVSTIQRQQLNELQKANSIAEQVRDAIRQLKTTQATGTSTFFDPYA